MVEMLARGVVREAREKQAEVPVAAPTPAPAGASQLAEVQRVRQFFPETWIWTSLETGPDGKGSLGVIAPDTITTWQLQAVGVSLESGLGMSEDTLRVFQPFFVKVDLPYSSVRGEEFPVRVALYNYLEESQEIHVDLEEADWFELLDEGSRVVTVPAGEVGGCSFMIRPRGLGTHKLKSQRAALRRPMRS
jgi:CD109 antigen